VKTPFLQKHLTFKGKSWLYSFISLLNVLCGLAVTGLVWFRYSATKESDILLLATSSISILAQLSLVGVEQVLYFYADETKKSAADANHFFGVAYTWSLISGVAFTALVVLLSKYFLLMIAPGFNEDSLSQARHILLCLSPQLILSPCLHIFRAKWSLEEKFGRAYLLSAVNSFILLICLILATLVGTSSLDLFGTLSLAVFVAFLGAFVFYNRAYLVRLTKDDWIKVRHLVTHSSRIKGANAVHNFLVQTLISSLLSMMPTGSISIFQYAKRLADGVFAITAGPQVMIYHSRCAVSVLRWDRGEMRRNVVHFLKTFLPLFFAMATVVYVLAPFALSIMGKGLTAPAIDQILWLYVGTALWYLIIGVETLSVGILLATHSSWLLFCINFTFIFLFFSWTRFHKVETSLELIGTTAGFQLVSFTLFTLSALMIIHRRSKVAR
jgi:hypothetical protein